jgi:hypothetical protein
VAVDHQRAAARVRAGKARHDVGASWRALPDLRGETDLVEQACDVLRGLPLAPAGVQVAGVRAVDRQQPLAQVDHLVGGGYDVGLHPLFLSGNHGHQLKPAV